LYEKWQYRLVGFFANATAIYKNWATLDLAIRNDQNSILPKANNSYTYYSVAGTVNLKKALDIKTDMLSSLKIRANAGLVGSAKPDFRYLTDSYYGNNTDAADGFGPNLVFPFNGQAAFSLNNGAGNPELRPEFTRSTEGGVEFGLFGERLTFNGTMYQQKSTDVILRVPNSAAAGINSVLKNAGELTTNGVELQVSISPIKNVKGFNWTTTFNYTQFKTIVDTLASGVPKIQLGGFVTPGTFLVAHEEYGQIYGNRYQRANDATGTKFDGTLDYNETGKIIVNASGLPLITPNTYKIGNPNPQYILGISNTVSYKGLELSFLVDIKKGGDQYSRNLADIQRQGAAAETAVVERLNADGTPTKPYIFAENNSITTAGVANTIPITSEQFWGNSGKYAAAEGFIFNTDWVRIREASLSYTLQKDVLKSTPFGAVTVGVFGRNLFLSSPNYPHLDPEQNVSGVSNSQGLEFNALPQTKSMGFNLKVTF
jgi:hypothetical protein